MRVIFHATTIFGILSHFGNVLFQMTLYAKIPCSFFFKRYQFQFDIHISIHHCLICFFQFGNIKRIKHCYFFPFGKTIRQIIQNSSSFYCTQKFVLLLFHIVSFLFYFQFDKKLLLIINSISMAIGQIFTQIIIFQKRF